MFATLQQRDIMNSIGLLAIVCLLVILGLL